MKKYLSLLIVLALMFVVGAYKVSAHEDGSKHSHDDDRMEVKSERKEAVDDWKSAHRDMKAKRAEMMRDMKEKREMWKEDMKIRWSEGANVIRGRIVIALLERTENLTQIAGRIETRVEKLEAAGIDTGSAQSMVNTAESKLASAKDKIEDLKDSIEADKNIEELREALKSIKEDLKSAHASLRSAVEEIKKNVVKEL